MKALGSQFKVNFPKRDWVMYVNGGIVFTALCVLFYWR